MITVVQKEDIYEIRFSYNPQVISLIKNVPGRQYNLEHKYWTIPVDRLGFLIAQFKGTCYEKELKIYSAEHLNENATLDSTQANSIPNIDISKIQLYVHEGDNLFQHQKDFMKFAIDRQRRGLYSGFLLADEQGLGKALSLDTKIYTPTGYKLMRDICVGDYVFGRDGNPTQVTAVYDHHDVEMYRFTFSDGVTVDCCKDHLWQIYDSANDAARVVPTSWFLGKDHFGKIRKDHLKNISYYRYWVPLCDAVNFEPQEIPLDPYLVGILLGDGCLSCGAVDLSTNDSEIVDYIKDALPPNHRISRYKNSNIDYRIVSTDPKRHNGCNEVLNALRQLNLLYHTAHTKFIPEIYKYNTVAVRKAVLQGLIDTDGYCTSDNMIQYSSVSKQLAEDVRFLVESIGGFVSWSEGPCGYNGKITGVSYNLTIKFNNPQELVRLTRRKKLLHARKFKPHRNIIKIEKIPNADARCITVDNSEHLYLIDHFIVTHNTMEALNLALYNKKYNKLKHCLIIACVNSAKFNWIADIEKHTNGEYIPYLLGSRLKRDGTVRTDTGSAEKLEDLKYGKMYGKKGTEPLPFFLVINIEAFHYRKDRHYLIREQISKLLNKGTIGMVVLDEVHRNLGMSSRQGKQILKLKNDTTTRVEWLPMTGTPIVNRPTDVFLPLKLIDGHTYKSYYNWCDNFCIYGNFGDVVGYKNIPQLKQMLQGNMLRRLKSEVMDLPPKLHTIEYVENTAYQSKLYNKVLLDTINHRDDILSSNNPIVKMLKLRQVNGSPELVDQNLVVDKSYLAKNSKMARLVELVSTIVENDEKVVIFSNWVESLRTIYRFLAKDYKVCCYTGTNLSTRENEKKRFIEDKNCPIMIGTVGALGVSHTLTVANNVIFYDLPWNPATMQQAEDRCHRAGTTSTVNVYSIITKDTVDEKVYKLIQDKDGISKFIVDNQLSFKQHPELFDILFGKS